MALLPPPTPSCHRGSSESYPRPKAMLGAHTLQSFGKGTNENQDAFVASANGNKFLAGVFDGHGEKGKRISEFAKTSLSKNLFTHKELHNDPRLALESAYRDTQNQIEKAHGPDAAESGTTAVACYQHRDRLLVANVGDSRAVLGRCDTARKGMRAVELTSDHKPSRADEKQRILAAGGKVDQMTFPVWNPGGGLRLMKGGPERVMDSSGFGGLAMSRSLGDFSLRPYVSSQPEVVERKLDSRDRFLVLGSDGVWDQMSSQEAVDIACRVADPSNAAREIANQARRRWQSETEGLLSDDITAVVVRLEHDQSTANAGASTVPAAHARTAQNFRSRPGSGAMTPSAPGSRGGAGHRTINFGAPLDRSPMERGGSSPMDRHSGGSPLNRFGMSNHRPHSNASDGKRGYKDTLGHSASEPGLRAGGKGNLRKGYASPGNPHVKRNDLLPPAGIRK